MAKRLGVLIALCGGFVLGAMPAMAGVGIGVTPTVPASVVPVQLGLAASFQIVWQNTPGASNDLHGNIISGMVITPACGEFTAPCPAPSQEGPAPFPITLSGTSTSTDGTAGGCGGVAVFTLTGPTGNDGTYAVSPNFTLPVGGTCIINFTIDVNKVVANDADPGLSGFQTAFLVNANANDVINGTPGSGAGAAEISFPDLTTIPGPGGTLGPDGVPPVNLSDTATILGLLPDANFGPPTGTVEFKLYPPSNPTCTDPPFQAQTVDLANPAECTVTGATTTTAIVNDGDTTIPVVTTVGLAAGPATAVLFDAATVNAVLISYTSTDATNLLGVSGVINGPFPAGSQVSQTSANTFKIDCATTNTFTADAAGTWRWTAAYSGDADNQAVSSGCAEEPVQVLPPTPTIQTLHDPETGTLLAQDLLDFANLQDGFFPTGTITFTLYGPADPACTGSQIIHTEVFPVTENGVVGPATAPAAAIAFVGTYQWVASYSGDDNNSAVASICGDEPVVIDQPVLQIVKTPDTTADIGGLITAGDTATFTITLTNNGPGPAVAVELDDTLPGPLVWSFFSTTVGTCDPIVGNVLHCDVGDLTEGASVVVVVTAPTTKELCVATPPNANAQFINSLDGGAIGSAANAATVTDPGTIECQTPVITVVKTPDTTADVGGLITAGDTATFTITITNLGPGTAALVLLDDTLPGPLVWSFFSTTQGSCNPIVGNVLECDLDSLAEGASVTVVVTAPVSLAQCTPAGGQASVQFINALDGGAIASARNAFTVTDPGQIECVLPLPNIVKTPDGATIFVGDKATFTIVVSNGAASPVAWTNVTVTDQLPSPLSGGSWVVITQPSTGTCSVVPTDLLKCTGIGDLNPGDSRTIVVQTANAIGAVDALASFLNNVAFAGAPSCPTPGAYGIGTNAGPVCDPGTITVAGVPHLVVVKTPDDGTYDPGDPVSFTIVVTNDGSGTAHNVHFDPLDTLPVPAGSSLAWGPANPVPVCAGQSGPAPTCSVVADVLSCAFGDLAPGGSCSVTVTSATDAGNPADCVPDLGLVNIATVVDDEGDSATDDANQSCVPPAEAIFIVCDEEWMDNDKIYLSENTTPPFGVRKFFSKKGVNDDVPGKDQRAAMRFFVKNPGLVIETTAGQVGDEACFILTTIPTSWVAAGPTGDGLRNFIGDPSLPTCTADTPEKQRDCDVGNGLGDGSDPERLLDKIPGIPMRADHWELLEGHTVCFLNHDSDISANYNERNGQVEIDLNLKGEYLGFGAMSVLTDADVPDDELPQDGGVRKLKGKLYNISSSSLPKVRFEMLDPRDVCAGPLALFTDVFALPYEMESSSVPTDIDPEKACVGKSLQSSSPTC